MLMMCGLPACGKTTWAEKQCKLVPEAKYNILGTNSIIDRMKVGSKITHFLDDFFFKVAIAYCG